jgi:hypothetical protein
MEYWEVFSTSPRDRVASPFLISLRLGFRRNFLSVLHLDYATPFTNYFVLYLILDIKFMNFIIKATNFDVISFLHYLLQQCFYNQCLQITYLWLQNVFYQMIDDFEPSNIQNPHVVSGFKETHSSWFMVCFFN